MFIEKLIGGNRSRIVVGLVMVLLLCIPLTCGAMPDGINYQGQLSDSDGKPVENSTVTVVFSLYAAASGGTALWQESRSVEINGGVFNVRLGAGSSPFPTDLFSRDVLYLGIAVDGNPEMSPRQLLSSVPFAFRAGNALTLEGSRASSFAASSHSHLFPRSKVR